MTHLSPDTFVDLLDGTLADAAVPHLASCDTCPCPPLIQRANRVALKRSASETEFAEVNDMRCSLGPMW